MQWETKKKIPMTHFIVILTFIEVVWDQTTNISEVCMYF